MAALKERVIYTAITRGYDVLRPPLVVDPDTDYIAYTDAPEVSLPAPWQYRPILTAGRNPRVTAGWHKLLPHRHLAEYRYSLWIDGRVEISRSLAELFDLLAVKPGLAVFAHPERNCIYDEAEEVKRLGFDHPEIVDIQMAYYRRRGYPVRNGLFSTGALLRAHRDETLRVAMEDWWHQVETFSQRDQLSAGYVLWRRGLRYQALPGTIRENQWIRLRRHENVAPFPTGEETDQPIDWLRHAAIARYREAHR